jgi:SAM-dependent methyltransferase
LDGALDIGTGDGAFLEQLLALGFRNVTGVEPSAAPVAAAKPNIRPLIRSGMFCQDDFAPASFSLICCFQTLEHVWDPLAIIRAAYGLLKPGGAFIAVIHNRKALSAKVLGMKSPIFDIEHLQLFCPSTGRRLLDQAGFRDVRVATLWNRYPIHYWLRLMPVPKSVKGPLSRFLKQSVFGNIPLSVPAGNITCVGFK